MSHKIFIEDDNDLKESFEKFKENKKIDFKNEICYTVSDNGKICAKFFLQQKNLLFLVECAR